MMERPSEQSISAVFKDALSNSTFALERQHPSCFVDEFDGVAGRADFVLSPTQLSLSNEQVAAYVGSVTAPSSALILSILIRENLDEDELVEKIGLTRGTVKRVLCQLKANGAVEEGHHDKYRASPSLAIPQLELWAIELKIDNWRKAIYQSLQYQSYSHRTIIVVPMVFAHRIVPNTSRFESFNVGVVGIDEDGSMRTLVKAEKRKPSIDHHYLYAMSIFLRRLHPELCI